MQSAQAGRQSWGSFFLGSWVCGTSYAFLHAGFGVIATLVVVSAALVAMEVIPFLTTGIPHGFALVAAISSGFILGLSVFKLEREIKHPPAKPTRMVWVILLMYSNLVVVLAVLAGWLILSLGAGPPIALLVAAIYPTMDNWVAKHLRVSPGVTVVIGLIVVFALVARALNGPRPAPDRGMANRVLRDEWGPLLTKGHNDLQRKFGMRPA